MAKRSTTTARLYLLLCSALPCHAVFAEGSPSPSAQTVVAGEKGASEPAAGDDRSATGGTPAAEAVERLAPNRWDICPPVEGVLAPLEPAEPPPAPGATQLIADEAITQTGGNSLFIGNVMLQRDGVILQGDEAEYQRSSDQVTISGNVRYHTDELVISGDSATMNLGKESGTVENGLFHLPQFHAFGSAAAIEMQDNQHSTLTDISYTTCNPGHEDWLLQARELRLDEESNTGEAFHTTLRFKGVPVLYSPYINFPLKGRKSGLLPPRIGVDEQNGTDIALPVYWNIAPHRDATITPRNITARGPMVMGEFRFLNEKSEGSINAEYLANDKLYGDDRSNYHVRHKATLAEGWHSSLDYQQVSDEEYFSDFDGGPEGTSNQLSIDRHLDLSYRNLSWQFLGRVQDYQTLLGANTYQRLPQLNLTGLSPRRRNRLQFGLQSEAVAFRHDELKPTGNRLDLKPSVALPLEGDAWFLTPAVTWRYTEYALENDTQGDHFIRSLPIYSLDSGLFFERDLSLGASPYLQTLEPRLFFLSVPYENQDALPRFDTTENDFTFSQLFRDNRFNGADRQGDTEQVSVALTTRLIDETSGEERLRASVGQILYRRDREVTLQPSEPAATEDRSNIVGELGFSPYKAVSLTLDSQYNPHTHKTEGINSGIRYETVERRRISFDYRFNREKALRQSDIITLWPVTRRWHVLGRWRYDLENEMTLDSIAGFEYESCCWAVRVLGRGQRDTIDEEINHSVYLTFELKGLGRFGGQLEDVLEQNFATYE